MDSANLCAGFYDVTTTEFGLKFTLTSDSSPGAYNITVEHERTEIYNYNGNNTEPFEFKRLKPCTEYGHSVSFMKNGLLTPCNQTTSTASKTSTMGMSEC